MQEVPGSSMDFQRPGCIRQGSPSTVALGEVGMHVHWRGYRNIDTSRMYLEMSCMSRDAKNATVL